MNKILALLLLLPALALAQNVPGALVKPCCVTAANGGTGAATASANQVFSGPTSGGAAAPAFRALVTADMPGGTGSVTSFSAGNLSPLFTTSVGTPTTTPALTFSLTNAGANTLFGNITGGSAAPAFTATSTIPLSNFGLGIGLTGYLFGNGSSAITASSTIPTSALTGTLQAAQEPAHTGGVTNSAGSLALTVQTNANLTGPVTSSGNATTITPTITAGGPTGSATVAPIVTYNAAGQLTAVTSATITPAVGSVTGLGTGIATALGVNVGTAGAPVINGGALGTPSSGTLTNATGLPYTSITGLGTGIATWWATPSSANLAAALTDETGTGKAVFGTGPTINPAFLATRCYADQQAGATADVQINACNTTLTGLGGGTIDATGYGCTTQSINAVTSIGDASGHPVTLVIDRCTVYNVTVTGGAGVDAIKLFIRSSMTAIGMGNPLTADFVVQATTNVNSIIASYPRATQWVGMIQSIVIEGSTSATVLSEIDISGATALSRLMDVGIYNFNGNGLKITANAGATVDSLILDNLSSDGVGSTTGCPVLIDGTASSNLIVGISFIGGTLVHPGASCASHAIVDIEGGASDTTQGVHFYSTRLESSNTTDIGILINNALNVDIEGVSASANVNNGTSVVKITQTANVSYNITISNLGQFNAWTNTIQDVVNGVTKTGAAFPRITRYDVMPPTNGAWQLQQGVVTMRPPRTCELIADSSGSASATLANITWANSCVFQVDASTTYRYECDMLSTSTNAAGGLFMGITGPASPVASNYNLFQALTATTFQTHNISQTTTYSTTGAGVVAQAITTTWSAHFSGTFENGTTAGTLSMQWANGSATGSLVLKRGSACTVY